MPVDFVSIHLRRSSSFHDVDANGPERDGRDLYNRIE